MTKGAWVTLATNDSYSLGALVLAHSLSRVASAYPSVVIVTPSVTDAMKERLASVFAEVVTVDVLDSGDAAHLALLARPELGVTFTKIHCWNLVQYEKCVFLDADTLVLQNSDELFEHEEFSAAPDVGWPDCFNSGVFVYKPSKETFAALLQFAQERGSFDGGDQGLLNSYFSDWARGDSSRRLPFLYNVTSTAFYSYLPALKQFGENMKIIHFIGNLKPWLQSFNWNTRTVSGPSHLEHTLQHWWDIFTSKVHSHLDSAMEKTPPLEIEAPNENANYYRPVINPESEFPWHHDQETDVKKDEAEKKLEEYWSEFHDPWENYVEPEKRTFPFQDYVHEVGRKETDSQIENSAAGVNEENYKTIPQNNEHRIEITAEYEHDNRYKAPSYIYQVYHVEVDSGNEVQSVFDQTVFNEPDKKEQLDHYSPDIKKVDKRERLIGTVDLGDESKKSKGSKFFADKSTERVPPRHPYDFFYLRHRPLLDARGHKRCSHEKASPLRKKEKAKIKENPVSGLAGTFSKINIDADAADEVARRQGWEAGNMDYMGQDSFDKIWAKISQTLAQPTTEEKSISQDIPAVVPQETLLPDTVEPQKEETAVTKPVEELSANVSQAEPAMKDATEEKPEKLIEVSEIKPEIPITDEKSQTEVVVESHPETPTETTVVEEKQAKIASQVQPSAVAPETETVQTEKPVEKSTVQEVDDKPDVASSNVSEPVKSLEQTIAPVPVESKSEPKPSDDKPTETSQDQLSVSVLAETLPALSIAKPEAIATSEKSEVVASEQTKEGVGTASTGKPEEKKSGENSEVVAAIGESVEKVETDVASLSPPLVATPLTTPEKSSQEEADETLNESASLDQSAGEDKKSASGGGQTLRLNLPAPALESPRTPDSEFEDAASLAQRIISSEIAKERCTTAPPVTPPPRSDKPRHGTPTPKNPQPKASPSSVPVPPPRKKDKKPKK